MWRGGVSSTHPRGRGTPPPCPRSGLRRPLLQGGRPPTPLSTGLVEPPPGRHAYLLSPQSTRHVRPEPHTQEAAEPGPPRPQAPPPEGSQPRQLGLGEPCGVPSRQSPPRGAGPCPLHTRPWAHTALRGAALQARAQRPAGEREGTRAQPGALRGQRCPQQSVSEKGGQDAGLGRWARAGHGSAGGLGPSAGAADPAAGGVRSRPHDGQQAHYCQPRQRKGPGRHSVGWVGTGRPQRHTKVICSGTGSRGRGTSGISELNWAQKRRQGTSCSGPDSTTLPRARRDLRRR